MAKSRIPMQVAPKFEEDLKYIQKKIMKKEGVKISLRDLTEKMDIDLEGIEDKILKGVKVDIKINLDRRRK